MHTSHFIVVFVNGNTTRLSCVLTDLICLRLVCRVFMPPLMVQLAGLKKSAVATTTRTRCQDNVSAFKVRLLLRLP